MHACTMYLCTLHAATALDSALFVSSKACGVCNGYVRESLTAMKPKIYAGIGCTPDTCCGQDRTMLPRPPNAAKTAECCTYRLGL